MIPIDFKITNFSVYLCDIYALAIPYVKVVHMQADTTEKVTMSVKKKSI